jgi:phosphatidylglycerophosphatase C
VAVDHADHPQYTRTPVQKIEIVSQTIAFFDFDGTITTKDTLLEFIKYSKGRLKYYTGFLLNSPWLIAYRLKLISNQAAKERILTWFFRNTPLAEFQQTCDQFAADIIPGLLRPKALQEIALLRQKGTTIVLVSASPENWIRPWAGSLEINLIATRLQVRQNTLTGKITDKNCHGKEKVNRIHELYQLPDYSIVYAYGDSTGDKPMLQLANTAFYKPFR